MDAPSKPHKTVDATEARNRFGAVSRSTAVGPVLITRHGHPECILIRVSDYEKLLTLAFPDERLSDPGQATFDRIVSEQGASILLGVDPLEGSEDSDLVAALQRSLKQGVSFPNYHTD
jgi:prevent-host-death family protein